VSTSTERPIPEPSAAGRAAAEELRRRVAGRVLTTPLSRWLYSTDASSYRVVPEAVLVAGHVDDLAVAAEVAARRGVGLVARGAATSVAGQAIGAGIVVDCFRLDRILAIDPQARRARVEPGVIQASLNATAAAHDLELGPDTSTVDQATIGGMVGNDSSGSRSIIYGQMADKVTRVRGVLAGGDAVELGACSSADLHSGVRGGGLAEALESIRSAYGPAIAGGYPQTRRFTSGYDLRHLLGPRPHPGRLMAGSEGTLMLFTELEVELDLRPALRLGAALVFPSIRTALEANVRLLETGPSAVELLDLDPLRAAPNLHLYRRLAPLLAGSEPVMLTVEYQGDEGEVRAGLARLRGLERDLPVAGVQYLEDPPAMAEAAALRRAVLPLLMGVPGAARPTAFVEDTAVAPERLADYVERFQGIVAAHGVRASFSGHASAGCLHVRPLLDLRSTTDLETMQRMAREVACLVAEFHGVISGEHGVGRSRSWLLPELTDKRLLAGYVALKQAFDPGGTLGRGVILDGPGVAEQLRFAPGQRDRSGWRPRLAYRDEGGFEAAVERCFGAGQCKKLTGVMCPPASVTRDEARSTRARANALQAILAGAVDLAEVTDAEMEAVLGTCLACKACKTECPAGVDMAALKAEWLAERRTREGTPLPVRAVADIRRLLRLTAPLAPFIAAVGRSPLRRPLLRLAGVAPQRPLPPLATRSLTRRAAGRRRPAPGTAPIVLFADCFTQHQEPQIGEAFLDLMAAAGTPVEVIDAGCCGRTMMSTGLLEKARAAAAHAVERLDREVAAGKAVAFVEPSCLAMVHDDWRRLLPDDPRVARVAAASRFALSFVADAGAEGRLHFSPGGRALLHPHCHERAVFTSAETERALRLVPGLELEVLDAGCCGMSGVFGYQADHYELSVAIAERDLLPAVRAAAGDTEILATGTSCRSQIADLSPRSACHPLAFLAARSIRPC